MEADCNLSQQKNLCGDDCTFGRVYACHHIRTCRYDIFAEMLILLIPDMPILPIFLYDWISYNQRFIADSQHLKKVPICRYCRCRYKYRHILTIICCHDVILWECWLRDRHTPGQFYTIGHLQRRRQWNRLRSKDIGDYRILNITLL